ncbi:glycosyltransferase family 4 protein [Sphingomonas prati]|uniref:glycosyltransferase family 4 protein n=1 Tax=Sphingomonas prati TaxID=1843237 RepID=UPI001E52E8DD|nr:glycosyltransferase family 1 protein [Sphingomonas prati]
MPKIILDMSRLLSRVLHVTPTGVDRVEMAYARGLVETAGDRLDFAAVHPTGIYGRLPADAVLRFLDRTETRWETEGRVGPWAMRRSAVDVLNLLRPRPVPSPAPGAPAVYVQSSPHHLTNPKLVQTILRRENARFVCLVHDLIPLEYPEYARAGGAEQHRQRIETILRHAHGIMSNSHATLASLRPWIARLGVDPVCRVAHLGTHDGHRPVRRANGEDARPYFVSMGTIEPRKNHLLLLNLWRQMSERHGAAAIPKLVLIGRRGWENEQIVDMLERCPALVGCVEEHGGLSDQAARALLANANALLMPSFAEGYGMPVAEALDLGVAVVCSNLPSLREAGGGVPTFLDPLDGPAWHRAILAYADLQSPEAEAQRERLTTWQRPGWKDHIARLHDLISAVSI